MAFEPLQPPDAVQPVAFVEDHVSVLLLPAVIAVGLAARLTVGIGLLVTVTDALDCAVPPAPVHASVKVAVADGVTDAVPVVPLVPLQPPDAVQDDASVEDHVSVLLAPELIDVGLATTETVGAGVAGVLLPEPPPQAPSASRQADNAPRRGSERRMLGCMVGGPCT